MKRPSRVSRIAIALGLLLALGLLAACGADTGGATTGTPTRSAPAVAPTVKIVSPAPDAVVPAGTVTVAVETTGLEFVMPGGTNVSGQGHVHFTLDDGSEQMSIEREFEFDEVEPGTHTLVAELVQNDTDSFDPPIKQQITFTVK